MIQPPLYLKLTDEHGVRINILLSNIHVYMPHECDYPSPCACLTDILTLVPGPAGVAVFPVVVQESEAEIEEKMARVFSNYVKLASKLSKEHFDKEDWMDGGDDSDDSDGLCA